MDDQASPILSIKDERNYTKLQDLETDLADRTVRIQGRLLGGIGNVQQYSFILHDGRFSAQATLIAGASVSTDTLRFVAGLPKGSIISIFGTVKKSDLEILSCTQHAIEVHVEQVLSVAAKIPDVPVVFGDPATPVCGPRRVAFTTLSTVVGSANDPVLSFPSPQSFGGNDMLLTKQGYSFKKLNEKDFIEHCVKKSKGKFDFKMKAIRADGSEMDYGFVSARTSQARFTPLDMRGTSSPAKLEDVCDNELLVVMKGLLDLKKELGTGKNAFWKHPQVKDHLKAIKSIFTARGDGWSNGTNSRKRNAVIELVKGPLSTTRQTFNKYLEEAAM